MAFTGGSALGGSGGCVGRVFRPALPGPDLTKPDAGPHRPFCDRRSVFVAALTYLGPFAQECRNVEVLFLEVGNHGIAQRIDGYSFRVWRGHLPG